MIYVSTYNHSVILKHSQSARRVILDLNLVIPEGPLVEHKGEYYDLLVYEKPNLNLATKELLMVE